MFEAALPGHVDLDDLPDGQRMAAARPDEAIPLTDFDNSVHRHAVPFHSLAMPPSASREHIPTCPPHGPDQSAASNNRIAAKRG